MLAHLLLSTEPQLQNLCQPEQPLHQPTPCEEWVILPSIKLYLEDREVLSKSAWLNDRIVNGAQKILADQNKDIRGWQPTLYEQNLSRFVIQQNENDFIQIILIERNHWVTVSNIGCDVGVVHVYDSFYNTVSLRTKKQICSFWRPPFKSATFRLVNMQRQTNSGDCGLFAIATATELVNCPKNFLLHNIQWDTTRMRQHIISCFEKKQFSRFPQVDKTIIVPRHNQRPFRWSRTDKLLCICYMPNDKTLPMICCDHCNSWYHNECMGVDPDKDMSSEPWKCDSCSM